MRRPLLAVVLLALSCNLFAATTLSGEESATVKQGEYMFRAAGCYACHTATPDKPLAGGVALATPFGTFYSPNITPDKQTGIGNWSAIDFRRALREGKNPKGKHYYPAFPYVAYTQLTDADIQSLWSYLQTLPAITQPNKQHTLSWYTPPRPFLRVWKMLYFTEGVLQIDNSKSASWNRGAYLANAAAHCGECHTPRTRLGGVDKAKAYSGTRDGPDDSIIPNITPDRNTGIGKWSKGDIRSYLKDGTMPDGDSAGGLMAEVIDNGLSKLTAADIDAVVEYISSLPPISHSLEKKPSNKKVEKEAWE